MPRQCINQAQSLVGRYFKAQALDLAMHILGLGRAAFLEFLRNLTPMVLMASIALLTWAQLDFRRVDLSNWLLTMAFYVCALTAALSLCANTSAFLDNAFVPPLGLERAGRRLKRRGHSKVTLFRAMVTLTWRVKPAVFLEGVMALLVVYASLFVGVLSAISAATTALRNGIR
jgi:hypothetical protein